MAPTLTSGHSPTGLPTAGRVPSGPAAPDGMARDWAEIQERMLVPLYEAVYDRLEVGAGTRLLGLGCGSGLALLLAAARGAAVTGAEPDGRRLALARERLLPRHGGRAGAAARLLPGVPGAAEPSAEPFTLVTAFEKAGAEALRDATRLAERGSPVVLAGWGPPERCATAGVLRVADRLAARDGAPAVPTAARPVRVSGRDDLERLVRTAGLRPDGSGRVACPFGYPDMDSAVRGLVSTGLFEAAVSRTDRTQVGKELTEALHPFRRPDGTVRMNNVFRYLIARV